MGEEYRYRSHNHNNDLNQWYFDEYSGLYRQSSHTNLHQQETLSRSFDSSHQYNTSLSNSQPSRPFPWPESVERIHGWCALARKSQDPTSQLKLCRRFLATLAEDDAHQARSMVNQLMILECLRTLKRLSAGQGLGKGGDSEAQFILANCYGMGLLGLMEDHSKAFQWYVQASKQAHPEATYRTAVCHELGIGTRKDGQRAMVFYRKAAHLAHVGSMYKLGIILLRGYYNTTPLPREAISWLQRAATPHALHALAMIQLTGEVGDATSLIADPAYAMELLHQAAQGGYMPSQVQLGHCYEHGQWVMMDDALSIYWYARAAEQGSPEGCLALSGWYLTGSPHVPASDREAYLWARRAATTKVQATDPWTVAKAHFAVAIYLERGIGVAMADKDKAERWMSKAAAMGHTGAMQCLKVRGEYLDSSKKQRKAKEKQARTQKQYTAQSNDQHQHGLNRQEEVDKAKVSKCVVM
ncbi:hypothetical protein BC941DRAFT_343816 [Chlamydoabsidia padenii]|nr:hypothetical protein BC941DRAFT_343816 [Chlamydoabsidia padenii]